MLRQKAKVVPIECVARGYLAGSGWKEYQKTHTVCGVQRTNSNSPTSSPHALIFTPATKEDSTTSTSIRRDGELMWSYSDKRRLARSMKPRSAPFGSALDQRCGRVALMSL